jgi:uncharacterized peroxidase-related enzyme
MWIHHVPYASSDGRLRTLYDRVKGPDDNVDNIMLAHSLRPHSMEGHMALYKSVLHHSANRIPKWFLETLGVYTSLLNHCDYCVAHHYAGLERLLGDVAQAAELRHALERELFAERFEPAHVAALEYARLLTLHVTDEGALHGAVASMRAMGLDDGEILEVNQVVAYFNYANRTVLGLGVSTSGDTLGLSPGNSDAPDDWRHR